MIFNSALLSSFLLALPLGMAGAVLAALERKGGDKTDQFRYTIMRTIIINIRSHCEVSMPPVTFPVQQLLRSTDGLNPSDKQALTQKTHFGALPLPARLLLAVPRIRGTQAKAGLAERYTLDALGRIIDARPQRDKTIEAVNLLAEVLSTPSALDNPGQDDPQWLSATENMVLCVLCKIRSGEHQQARRLSQYWLSATSAQTFNVSAATLCDVACFKRGGPEVFSAGGDIVAVAAQMCTQPHATRTDQLTLGESLLLNAIRLRIRTLPQTQISAQVLPILSRHLCVPHIEALVDAHLLEALQYRLQKLDIRCLCSTDISADEAQLLTIFAAYATDDGNEVTNALNEWLPTESSEKLASRLDEFQVILAGLGSPVPQRCWDLAKLSLTEALPCNHAVEPMMYH